MKLPPYRYYSVKPDHPNDRIALVKHGNSIEVYKNQYVMAHMDHEEYLLGLGLERVRQPQVSHKTIKSMPFADISNKKPLPVKLRVAYNYPVEARNGGFGVLGKGFAEAIKEDDRMELVEEDPDIVFTYGLPEQVRWKLRNFSTDIPHVHYFVWESSKLYPMWAKAYSKADYLITATKYTADMAKKYNGLRVDGILHHAIDDRFRYRPPLNDGVFTFLHYNAYEYRKGYEFVIQAFAEEFEEGEPVQLLMKARERNASVWLVPKQGALTLEQMKERNRDREAWLARNVKLDLPQTKELIGHISDEEMVNMMRVADCFVGPAKGEGWSLPPMEAAACGIVPIIPEYGCFSEWFDDSCMLGIRAQGYLFSEPEYPGFMHMPSVKHLRRQMRWAFENQKEVAKMGKRVSKLVHEKYNWYVVTNSLFNHLKTAYNENRTSFNRM